MVHESWVDGGLAGQGDDPASVGGTLPSGAGVSVTVTCWDPSQPPLHPHVRTIRFGTVVSSKPGAVMVTLKVPPPSACMSLAT
jgi:hypothetical protein